MNRLIDRSFHEHPNEAAIIKRSVQLIQQCRSEMCRGTADQRHNQSPGLTK
ncbi:hypothetical protein [Rhodopirellula europaea]|uniref:hypothetical protein n=1 Tax=Rhodopirellula europaea TaxID=1263866 RepID=UPI0030EF6ACF